MSFHKYATTVLGKTRLPKGAYDILTSIAEINGGPGKFVKIELLSGKSYIGTLEGIIGAEKKGELPLDFLNNMFENNSSANYHYLLLKVPHDNTEYRFFDICDIKELKIFVPFSQNSEKGTYQTLLEQHGSLH